MTPKNSKCRNNSRAGLLLRGKRKYFAAKKQPFAMRHFLVILLAAIFSVALAKYKGGKDLDPDADLRIGVKYKPEGCTVFAAKGDKLSMEYTGACRRGLPWHPRRQKSSPLRGRLDIPLADTSSSIPTFFQARCTRTALSSTPAWAARRSTLPWARAW